MKFTVVIAAALLAVFLSPALATQSGKKNLHGHHGENSEHCDTAVNTDSEESSKAFKTVWDVDIGYVATKVFSKNTCIIARMDRSSFFDDPPPAPPQGHLGPRPHRLRPRENRFIISRHRLQHLHPYGKRIQALCRGIPSFFAYPAPGSSFLEHNFSCLKVKINEFPIYYCG